MGQLLHRSVRQCGELLEIISIIIQVIIQIILTTCFSLSRGAQGRFWSLVVTRRRIIVELRSQRCGSVAKLASKTP